MIATGTTSRPRVYDMQVEGSSGGLRAIAVHEIPPADRSPRRLLITEYHQALMLAICFGNQGQIGEAARCPEEVYRSREVVVGEDYFIYLRAIKRYLLGDAEGARSEGAAAVTAGGGAVTQREVELLSCVIDGDSKRFLQVMEKRLALHKKEYQKTPEIPDGVICQPGLLYCRLAIDRGMAVEDWPYLPVRLLPNDKPFAH